MWYPLTSCLLYSVFVLFVQFQWNGHSDSSAVFQVHSYGPHQHSCIPEWAQAEESNSGRQEEELCGFFFLLLCPPAWILRHTVLVRYLFSHFMHYYSLCEWCLLGVLDMTIWTVAACVTECLLTESGLWLILSCGRAGDNCLGSDWVIDLTAAAGLVTHLTTKLCQHCLIPDTWAKAIPAWVWPLPHPHPPFTSSPVLWWWRLYMLQYDEGNKKCMSVLMINTFVVVWCSKHLVCGGFLNSYSVGLVFEVVGTGKESYF